MKDFRMNILNINDVANIPRNNDIIFVSGVTGQDGSYMVDYLLENTSAMIIGGARRLSNKNHNNLSHIENNPRFKLVNFDLTDPHSITKLIEILKPDYFINFAAQSYVGSSWDFPVQTWECNTTGVIHILEAIKQYAPLCRIYNAGSSERFGDIEYTPQDEKHPAKPRSPYGASKVGAENIVKVYRDSYNLYAIQGILFNHESTRRGEEFVTRKISKGVARIKHAIDNNQSFDPISLGNVYAKRDWSHAYDFVDGIWKMLNQEIYRDDLQPELYQESEYYPCSINSLKEYVLSSDETHTIKEFIELAFSELGINGIWHGERLNEQYSISRDDAEKYEVHSSILVNIDPAFYRPAEVDILCGNSNLARKELKWSPKIDFKSLVKHMVINDYENIK